MKRLTKNERRAIQKRMTRDKLSTAQRVYLVRAYGRGRKTLDELATELGVQKPLVGYHLLRAAAGC